MQAAKNGHKNIVKELLRREIDVQALNGDGNVCWELAVQYNYKPLAQ
jgi:ankyrin repeat protein